MIKNQCLSLLILTIIFIVTGNLKAAIINVSSISALQTAINNSTTGDIINLGNGHYANNNISISKNTNGFSRRCKRNSH